jgi:hypothetical protein
MIVLVVIFEVGWLLRRYAFTLAVAIMALTLVAAALAVVFPALAGHNRDGL